MHVFHRSCFCIRYCTLWHSMVCYKGRSHPHDALSVPKNLFVAGLGLDSELLMNILKHSNLILAFSLEDTSTNFWSPSMIYLGFVYQIFVGLPQGKTGHTHGRGDTSELFTFVFEANMASWLGAFSNTVICSHFSPLLPHLLSGWGGKRDFRQHLKGGGEGGDQPLKECSVKVPG